MNVCIAVVSSSNSPLFLKTTNNSSQLTFHFRVHCALDVIDTKIGNGKVSYNDKESANKYLGLLYSVDDHYIYGYVTNTNVKVRAVF